LSFRRALLRAQDKFREEKSALQRAKDFSLPLEMTGYRSIRLRDVDLPTRAEQVYLALEEQSLNFESDPALVWIKLNSVIATMIG
jgi:hypothetical protein